MGLKFPISRFANIYPMMTTEELVRLGVSIAMDGLKERLLVNSRTGELLDGRNRTLSCEQQGIEITKDMVEYRDFTDLEARQEVVRRNNRRDMTPSQRAAAGLQLERIAEEDKMPLSKAELATVAGVSVRQLRYAQDLVETAPEYVEPVKAGLIRVNGARKAMAASPEDQSKVKAAIETGDKTKVTAALKSIGKGDKITSPVPSAEVAKGAKSEKFLSGSKSHLKYEGRDTRIGKLSDFLGNAGRIEKEAGEVAAFAASGGIDPGIADMLLGVLQNGWLKEGAVERATRALNELERSLLKASNRKPNVGEAGAMAEAPKTDGFGGAGAAAIPDAETEVTKLDGITVIPGAAAGSAAGTPEAPQANA